MKIWRIMLLIICGVLFSSSVTAAETMTRLTLTGPAGEYISQGQTLVFTREDGNLMLYHGPNTQNGINFRFYTPNFSHNWTVEFGGPDGTSPQVGLYTDAQRFPFAAPGHPRLNIYGDGRGCNELTGSFEVKLVTYNGDGAVISLWVTFTQFCDGQTMPLTGELIFNLDPSVPTKPTSWGQLKSYYR